MAAAAAKDFRARASVIKISDGPDGPDYPYGLTEMNGNLYFLGMNQVFQVDLGGVQTLIAGNLLEGHADGPLLAARFKFDYSSDMTSFNGDLYIADYGNNAVRKITLDRAGVPGQVSTLFGGNGRAAANGENFATVILRNPRRIMSNANDLYIIDATPGFRIRKIDMRRERVTTLPLINSTGIHDYLSPGDMVANETDIYFISGYAILRVNLASMNMTIFAGNYQIQGENNGTRLDATFYLPTALAIVRNNLYVTDESQMRVISLTEDRVTTLVALKEATVEKMSYSALEFMTSSGDVLFVSDDSEAYSKLIKIDINPDDRKMAFLSLLRARPPNMQPPWLKKSRRNKKSRQTKSRKNRN